MNKKNSNNCNEIEIVDARLQHFFIAHIWASLNELRHNSTLFSIDRFYHTLVSLGIQICMIRRQKST